MCPHTGLRIHGEVMTRASPIEEQPRRRLLLEPLRTKRPGTPRAPARMQACVRASEGMGGHVSALVSEDAALSGRAAPGCEVRAAGRTICLDACVPMATGATGGLRVDRWSIPAFLPWEEDVSSLVKDAAKWFVEMVRDPWPWGVPHNIEPSKSKRPPRRACVVRVTRHRAEGKATYTKADGVHGMHRVLRPGGTRH